MPCWSAWCDFLVIGWRTLCPQMFLVQPNLYHFIIWIPHSFEQSVSCVCNDLVTDPLYDVCFACIVVSSEGAFFCRGFCFSTRQVLRSSFMWWCRMANKACVIRLPRLISLSIVHYTLCSHGKLFLWWPYNIGNAACKLNNLPWVGDNHLVGNSEFLYSEA